MKTLKNFEAMFVVAVALACSASYVSFTQPQAVQTASVTQGMHVVTVSAKRMTEQEKQLSLLEERQELSRNATASTL